MFDFVFSIHVIKTLTLYFLKNKHVTFGPANESRLQCSLGASGGKGRCRWEGGLPPIMIPPSPVFPSLIPLVGSGKTRLMPNAL